MLMKSKRKTFNKFEDDVLRHIKGFDAIYLVEAHFSESVPPPSDKYNIYHFISLMILSLKLFSLQH